MNLKEEVSSWLSTIIKCTALYPIVWVLYLITVYNAMYITVNLVSNGTLKAVINSIYTSNIYIVVISISVSIIYLFHIKIDFLGRPQECLVNILRYINLIFCLGFTGAYFLEKISKLKSIYLFYLYLALISLFYITFSVFDFFKDKTDSKMEILHDYNYIDYINQINFNNENGTLIKAFRFFWGVALLIMIFIYPIHVVVSTGKGKSVDLITLDKVCCNFTLLQTVIITYFIYKIYNSNVQDEDKNEKWKILSNIFSKGIIVPIITLIVNLITNYLKSR